MIIPGVPIGFSVPGSGGPTPGSRDAYMIRWLLWFLIAGICAIIIGRLPQIQIQIPLMLLIHERQILLIYELNPGTRKDRLTLRLVYWFCVILYLVPSYSKNYSDLLPVFI